MRDTIDLEPFRPQINAALAYSGDSHTFEDVVAGVQVGKMQAWPGGSSIIITQVDECPGGRVLWFFLAGGNQAELSRMTPPVLAWGKSVGCTKAQLLGRRGWLRSFLPKTGWVDTQMVLMAKAL